MDTQKDNIFISEFSLFWLVLCSMALPQPTTKRLLFPLFSIQLQFQPNYKKFSKKTKIDLFPHSDFNLIQNEFYFIVVTCGRYISCEEDNLLNLQHLYYVDGNGWGEELERALVIAHTKTKSTRMRIM